MAFKDCIGAMKRAAGRDLSDEEVRAIFERVHRAALDIKAGRVPPGGTVGVGGGKLAGLAADAGAQGDALLEAAARRAAAELQYEAELRARQANLQVIKLAARSADVDKLIAGGMKPLEAVEKILARDYSGRFNQASLEASAMGTRDYYMRQLLTTWDALGRDFLGFFQDEAALLDLVREIKGENTGNALARQGAEAWLKTTEEARAQFNAAGGNIGKLHDWGMPQHHSQHKVAAAGRDQWVADILPRLDRSRYVDDLGNPFDDTQMVAFLNSAWETIATDGIAKLEPGKFSGTGKRANRHAEARQIHFKDAQNLIEYWRTYGDRTPVEIMTGHMEVMARDIAFIEFMGPNPNVTYRTLRDGALKAAVTADPRKTQDLKGRALKLDELYDYAAGRLKPSANMTAQRVFDGLFNLNVAGKLGSAMLASLFGDKVMFEAVSHLNRLPMMRRWANELALLSPFNASGRRLAQEQGLMLDTVRSGINRFYEGLGGGTGYTGKLANAVMRISGMQAINDVRKAAFGRMLMNSIGSEINRGRSWQQLASSDVRLLRNYGITPEDWATWSLAQLRPMGEFAQTALTPEAIMRIPDDALRQANVIGQADPPEAAHDARRRAVVKLLSAVNTESEFAVVTPGWKERAAFYGDLQRGTVKGELARSVLQFKSFPFAYFRRAMDAVANSDGPVSKATMTAFILTANALAGAMILQTREVLAGKDPRKMYDERDPLSMAKFWGAAFMQGGALGLYGDFIYGANQTRYGSGPIEAVAGPSLGPLLELGLVQPLGAIRAKMEGRDSHLLARTVADLKGFFPGNNLWYTKAATEHLIWQNVMESLSPGYLKNIRQRTQREYRQRWWWDPGTPMPQRAPSLEAAVGRGP